MKKPLYVLACLTALVLSACAPSTSSNSGNVNPDNSDNPGTENPGTSVIEPYESFWGNDDNKNVREAIESSIRYDIPYYKAPTYVAEIDPSNGPLDVGLQVSFVGYPDAATSEEHCNKYLSICEGAKYRLSKETASDGSFTFDYYLATKAINETEEVVLTIVAGGLSETQLGFAVFGKRNQICDPKVFPNNMVKAFLGYEIPEVKYPGMTFTYMNDATYYQTKDKKYGWYEVYIEVYGGDPVIESEYHGILEDAGYTFEDGYLNPEEGYKATSPDGKHGIQFLWVDNPRIHNALCILTFLLDH